MACLLRNRVLHSLFVYGLADVPELRSGTFHQKKSMAFALFPSPSLMFTLLLNVVPNASAIYAVHHASALHVQSAPFFYTYSVILLLHDM